MTAPGINAQRLLVVAGLAVAGGIHLGIAAQHADTAHLVFFASTGTAQAGLAVALARRESPVILRLAALISVAVTTTWVATRAGVGTRAESVGFLDAAATAAELVTAVAALAVMRRARPPSRRSPRRRQLAAAAAVLLAAGAATLIAPAHDHSQPGPSQPVESERPNVFGDLFEHHSLDEGSHDGAHNH